MDRETLSKWFGGPVLHTHLHQEGRIVEPDVELHQFTQLGALSYLTRLTGKPDPQIADTDHAMIEIGRHRNDWLQQGGETGKQLISRKIAFASNSVLRRHQESRLIKGILTGVETDIINENGEVSTSADVLNKLDIVIASFHWRTWKKSTDCDEITEATRDNILGAYMKLPDNPHVDILGHPTVFPDELKALFFAEDFRHILEKMKNRNMAMEFNLSVNLTVPGFQLEKDILKIAGEVGVPIAIGCDLHHLNNYNLLGVNPEYITADNWERIFEEHQTSGCHFSLFRFMARNIRLLEFAKIDPKNVINASYENFTSWLARRPI